MNMRENRQGSIRLTAKELSDATRILVVTRKPELMYDYLESKGDRYANLANSVVKGDSLLGAFAINHLDGFKLENNKNIPHSTDDEIRFNMAEEYLIMLYKRFDKEGFIVQGDINNEEAMIIHDNVFEKLGLSKEAWTLKIVLDVMPEEQRESYWQSSLNAVGDTEKETLLSLLTIDFMLNRLAESPAKDQPKIHSWIRKAIDIDNVIDGLNVTAKKTYKSFFSEEPIDNIQYNNYILYNTGNPLIDKGTDRFSFWNHPSRQTESFQVQLDWRGQPLSEYYLERPDYMLPETGLFDSPSVNYQPDVAHYDSMVGQLRDNMSSINNSMSSFDDRYSVPRMPNIPEFSYSDYSSGGSFSFN